MDVLDRHLVDVGLGPRQPADELDGPRAHARRQGRRVNQPFDLGERPMPVAMRVVVTAAGPVVMSVVVRMRMVVPVVVGMVVVVPAAVGMVVRLAGRTGPAAGSRFPIDHDDAGGRDARADDARDFQVVIDGQLPERGPQDVEGQARVEERAEQHVARRARRALDVQDSPF
jgi:hypothetical protein